MSTLSLENLSLVRPINLTPAQGGLAFQNHLSRQILLNGKIENFFVQEQKSDPNMETPTWAMCLKTALLPQA